MFDALYAALRRLPDTGPRGFEGFAAAVLQEFTPELAITFLAKAGYQRGVDASSAGWNSTWAGLECKHYGPGKCPTARELAGGLTLATNGARDQLDAWVLVTTGAIGALEAGELQQAADREAVAFVTIDWQQAGLPRLALLCAAVSDATIRELSNRLPKPPDAAVRADLAAIAAEPNFLGLREQLQHRLSLADIGFAQARNAANTWVLQSISSSAEARARLGQPLCPRDGSFSVSIDRPSIRSALDTWYATWDSRHAVGVLHGREGAGKSWVGLDWWNTLLIKPLTLLTTSNVDVSAEDSIDLLAGLLIREIGTGDPQTWRRRLERWLKRPPGRDPVILLIVDGLNEQPRENWAAFFAGFRVQSLVGHVAVVATCWSSHWESQVQPRLPEDLPIHLIRVPPFDDVELRDALQKAGHDFDAVPSRVREFMRVPRVFRIAVQHLEDLRFGQLTVERLLLIDWRSRLRTEYGISHTESEFRRIVVGLARDIRAGAPNFGIHDLRAHSSLAQRSPNRDLDRDFGEIVEGDLFERDPNGDGELRVKQEHIGLLLGMLLADEVRRAGAIADLDAVIEQSIENVAGFSEASEVLRGAVATASHWSDYPDRAVRALLRGWLRLRNRPEMHLDDFEAYLPDRVEAYLGIADDLWVNFDRYHDSREWLAAAIVSNLGRPDVLQSVQHHVNRWLGYWHEAWFPFLGRAEQPWLDRRSSEVRTTLDQISEMERELIRQYSVEPADENYAFAAELALLIVSQGPRAPYIPGFVAWALSRTIMKLPVDADRVAWCLCMNRIDPNETERRIIEAADRLSTAGSIGRDAAILLLRTTGTDASVDRLSALHANPVIRQSWQRAARVLPPSAESPDLAPYLGRLSEINPGDIWAHRSVTVADHDFEDMEPAVAAFAAHDVAAFVQRVLRTAPQRDQASLQQLALQASAHSMLIGLQELEALEHVRRRTLAELQQDASREAAIAESYLMLAVSPSLTPEQRFERLAERPDAAHMLLSLERTFAPLSSEACNRHLIAGVARNDSAHLRAALWYLSSHRFDLTDEARVALVQCFSHSDHLVRICAFQLAACCRDSSVLASLREGTWVAPRDEQASSEGFYGSKALALSAAPGDYAELRTRVSPELWGFLAECDGSEEAFRAFAHDLDLLLRTLVGQDVGDPSRAPPIVLIADRSNDGEPQQSRIDIASRIARRSTGVPSLSPEPSSASLERLREMLEPGAFDRQAQESRMTLAGLYDHARQIGAMMFGRQFRLHGIAELIRLMPDLVDGWLAMLQGEHVETVVWRAGEFCRSLATALADHNPGQAVAIIRRLQRNNRGTRTVFKPLMIDDVTSAAFKIADCADVAQLRDDMLDEAVTDEELFVIALSAQRAGASSWLIRVIERDAASQVLALQARALTLVGWLDAGLTLDRLLPLLAHRRGYLGEVARTAEERLDRDHLARTWFREFLSRRDHEAAWAAFRVTLRCADRRFYLWSEVMMAQAVELPERWRLCVAVASDHIRNAIARNEGKLEDTLFGTKIGSSKVLAPWKRI